MSLTILKTEDLTTKMKNNSPIALIDKGGANSMILSYSSTQLNWGSLPAEEIDMQNLSVDFGASAARVVFGREDFNLENSIIQNWFYASKTERFALTNPPCYFTSKERESAC